MNSVAVIFGTGKTNRLRALAGAMLGVALALAAGPGQAIPAAAAGNTVYVDDTVSNNGTTKCSASAIITSNLSSLTITSGETLYICPGVYTGQIAFTGLSSVKIIGKGSPTIQATHGITALISATGSTNVTVQGLVLDGNNAFDPTYVYGIYFNASNGTISNNYLVRMHETPMSASCYGVGMTIFDAPGAVKILKNTVYDFECSGIEVSNSPSAVVQNNQLWVTSASGSDPVGISVDTSPKVSISKNSVNGDWNYLNPGSSVGIHVQNSPYAKIASNKINDQTSAITVATTCPAVGLNADHTSITGNIAQRIHDGIQVYVNTNGGSACDATSNLDTIKGNKFYADLPVTSAWMLSLYSADGSGSFDPQVSGMVLSGNQYANLADLFYVSPNPGLSAPTGSGNTRVMPPLGF